jgi:hypothetical protein
LYRHLPAASHNFFNASVSGNIFVPVESKEKENAIENINRLKFTDAKAKEFLHLEAWVRVLVSKVSIVHYCFVRG